MNVKFINVKFVRIFTPLYIIFLILGGITPSKAAGFADKPTPIPTPIPAPTSTPEPPSYTSGGWIGNPPGQQIAGIFPLKNVYVADGGSGGALASSVAVVVTWDISGQNVYVDEVDGNGAQFTHQVWNIGVNPGALTLAACGRNLWIGVNATGDGLSPVGGYTSGVQVRRFELLAEVCVCSEKSSTYIPIVIK